MCICKNSEFITTSRNLADVLDFRHISTSHEIGNATTRKLDPENVVVAVGIVVLYVIVSEILIYYFLLVGCHLGFSTRGSVGHDCWTFRCIVHGHKPMYCFWNDMCIYKTNMTTQ